MMSTENAATTVLVGIANPRTIAPLVRVARLLTSEGATRLLAVRVIVVPSQMSLSSARTSPEVTAASGLLREAIDAANGGGVPVDGIVELGREVHEGLAAAAHSRGARALVIGWSDDEDADATSDAGEDEFDRLMHRVARAIDVDLVVAKFRRDTMRRVLVPFCASPHLALLAELVRGLAAAGSEITFLHVVEASDTADDRERDVNALLATHGLGDAGDLDIVVSDSVAGAVVERAENFDVAIIGAAAKTALAEAVFSSKAESIAADVPCSVLVARAAGVR